MKLSFVGAALLISVLSTDAQNYIPNPPPAPQPPPPPPPQGYSGSQGYSLSANYNSQPPDPGNRDYRNNVYFGNPNRQNPPPPSWFPRDFGPPDQSWMEKWIESLLDNPFSEMFDQMIRQWKKKRAWRKQRRYGPFPYNNGRHQGYAGPPPDYFGPPRDYPGPSQDYPGPSQGNPGPPQGYPGPPQDYPVPGTQPSGFPVPPSSGTQQSNYGSNPGMYSYSGSVPQQSLSPGQSLPAAPVQNGIAPSAFPSPQYSSGPATYVPPPSAPAASLSSGVQVPSNSTLPASGMPVNSIQQSPASNGQAV